MILRYEKVTIYGADYFVLLRGIYDIFTDHFRASIKMDLEQRIQKIEERNAEVTTDKMWETSWTRRGLLAVFTYAVAVVFLWAIGVHNFFASALVPVGGFLISTLTMSYFKHLWLEHKK